MMNLKRFMAIELLTYYKKWQYFILFHFIKKEACGTVLVQIRFSIIPVPVGVQCPYHTGIGRRVLQKIWK